jgi:hypothetical protein
MGTGVVTRVCRDAVDVARLLLRHHRARWTGQPILTVVAGTPWRCLPLLAELDRELGRDMATVESATAIAAATARRLAASTTARASVLRGLGLHDDDRSMRTVFDWRRLVSTTGHDDEASARIAQAIVNADGDALYAVLATGHHLDPHALRSAAALVGADRLPGIRVVVDRAAAIAPAMSELGACFAVPPVATELLAPWPAVEAWLAISPPRLRALASDGLIRLPDDRALQLTDDEARYRTLPERLLHEALEADPATRGLFVPNAALDVRFGRSTAEVDFLCDRHRVVVEVDGWHHFRAPDHYRRDRRKDLTLQERGYVVVRVLAADVVEDAAAVAALVRDATARRLQ